MPTVPDYIQKIALITGTPVKNNAINFTLSFPCDNAQEARILIADFKLKQKELNLLKKDIHVTMQQISKTYVSQRVQVGKSLGSGFMRGLIGSRSVGKYNMLQRNSITMQKDQALRPYHQLITDIDNMVLAYEKAKMSIEERLLHGLV